MLLHLSPEQPLPPDSDKALLPPELLQHVLSQFPDQNLPHPLTFSLKFLSFSATIGVKQFTADLDLIVLPQTITSKLHASPGDSIEIDLVILEKALFLKLKPLQFYHDISNWKYYLESQLTQYYTALTKGSILSINGYQLCIEDTNLDVVCIIDTDIVLDIVPLNDIMAQQQLQFSTDNLEEIKVGDSVTTLVIPFTKSPKVTSYKVNIMDLDVSKDVVFKLKTSDDFGYGSEIYNMDLVIGFDGVVSLENFEYSTLYQDLLQELSQKSILVAKSRLQDAYDRCKYDLDQGFAEDEIQKWFYIVPFTWEYTGNLELVMSSKEVSEQISETEESNPSESSSVCGHCHKPISSEKIPLHEAFCYKNNIICSCGQVFLHEIPQNHWHCPHCSQTSSSPIFKFKHSRLFHQQFQCDKCDDDTIYSTFVDLIINHKAKTCPNKLHICRFCYLIVPQEKANYIDNFENLTHHENTCGNKTDNCYKCQRLFKRKDLRKHLRIHKLDKKSDNDTFSATFNKCSNENCIALVTTDNDLNLCDGCYGPLYITTVDPNHSKLQARIERKYMLQMNKGCDSESCVNQYCKRNQDFGGIKQIMEVLKHQLYPEIVTPKLPVNKEIRSGKNRFWFCVTDSMYRKLLLYQTYKEEYPSDLVIKGINEVRNIDELEDWLKLEM